MGDGFGPHLMSSTSQPPHNENARTHAKRPWFVLCSRLTHDMFNEMHHMCNHQTDADDLMSNISCCFCMVQMQMAKSNQSIYPSTLGSQVRKSKVL